MALSSSHSIAIDAQAKLYIDRAGITDGTEVAALDTLFIRLQDTAAIWTSISAGALYLCSPTNVAAALLNAVSTDFTLTFLANGPIYTTSGWQFEAQGVLATGWIPSDELASINTGLYGFYCGTTSTGTTNAMGCLNGSTQRVEIVYNDTGGNMTARAYNNTNNLSPSVSDSLGSHVFSIESSTARHYIIDGSDVATDSNTVGGTLPTVEMVLGARNNAGTLQNRSDGTFGTFFCAPTGLSSANAQELSNAITAYNNTVISGGR